MIIKCIVCKKDFEQKRSERRCGCNVYKPHAPEYREKKRKHMLDLKKDGFLYYIHRERMAYQNPYVQWYRQFISSEQMPPQRRHTISDVNSFLEHT